MISPNTLALNPNIRYLLACSGGVDSMVLAHMMHVLRLDFGIAHVHYALRGSAAELDFKLVQTWAKAHKIPFYSYRLQENHPLLAKNLQATARDIRREWFLSIAHQLQYDGIVLAHHANDQIETFIMRLGRGSNMEALIPMQVVKKQWYRPLLHIEKSAIKAYARLNNVPFREDESNKKDYYLRNAIRNNVIPQLENLMPGFVENSIKSINNLENKYKYLSNVIQKQASAIKKEYKLGVFYAKTLLKLENDAAFFISILLETDQTYITPEWTAKWLTGAITEQKHFRGKSFIWVFERAGIWKIAHQFYDAVNPPVSWSPVLTPKISTFWGIFEAQLYAGEPYRLLPNQVWLSAIQAQAQLTIRNRQNGDVIIPYGKVKEKTLSDILINKKTEYLNSHFCPVLECNNKLLWAPGIIASTLTKVEDPSLPLYLITWKTNMM